MKAFLRRLFIFLLPLALLAVWAEYRMSDAYNTLKYKKGCLHDQADEVELLVMGSSHTLFGVDTGQMGRPAFNLAGASQTLYYDSHLLNRVKPSLSRLKYVVIAVSYPTMWAKPGLQEKWRESFYSRFWGVSPESGRVDWRSLSFVAMYSLPSTRRYLSGNREEFIEQNPVEPNGWQPLPVRSHAEPFTSEGGRRRVGEHHRMMDPARFEFQARYLRQMVDGLQAQGLRPILLTTPCQAPYWQQIDPGFWEPTEAFLTDLCQEKGITWLSLFKDARFNSSDFFDYDHVNAAGAQKLARIVAQALPE